MKNITTFLAVTSLTSVAFLSSCAQNDPEYQAWLKEKKAKEAAAANNNPYNAPQAPSMNNGVNLPADPNNPYAAPNSNGIMGTVNHGNNAPLQPLGSLPDGTGTPYNPATVSGGPSMNVPAGGSITGNVGPTVSHTVVKGDTVWGLARKYNVTQHDIFLANNLSDTNIRIGQVLQIPQR